MENFGFWLPTSAITQSCINIQMEDARSWGLDFFSGSHHLHPSAGSHSQDHEVQNSNKLSHLLPYRLSHSAFPPKEDLKFLDPQFSISPLSALFPSLAPSL